VDIRHLRSFVAVAREQSYTRAARRLGVAQPTLSQQIQALERELGVVLIERSNRTLVADQRHISRNGWRFATWISPRQQPTTPAPSMVPRWALQQGESGSRRQQAMTRLESSCFGRLRPQARFP
jgi:Bacterial regulatory helix-turn-helix protein, lysR family